MILEAALVAPVTQQEAPVVGWFDVGSQLLCLSQDETSLSGVIIIKM